MRYLLIVSCLFVLSSCSTGSSTTTAVSPSLADSSYFTVHKGSDYDSSYKPEVFTAGTLGSGGSGISRYEIVLTSTKYSIQLGGSRQNSEILGTYYYPWDSSYHGANPASFLDRTTSTTYPSLGDSNKVVILRNSGYTEGTYELYIVKDEVRSTAKGYFKIKK